MSHNFENRKRQLESDKKKLLGELAKTQKPEDFGSDVDDFDEEKNEAESRDNQLALGQEIKSRISDIDTALNKITEGKYGVCENCGKNIEEKVLEVSPESRFCQSCKRGK